MRKGQKLCNWILTQGYINETVHAKLFNMDDQEFTKVIKTSWNDLMEERRKDEKVRIRKIQKDLGGKPQKEKRKKVI